MTGKERFKRMAWGWTGQVFGSSLGERERRIRGHNAGSPFEFKGASDAEPFQESPTGRARLNRLGALGQTRIAQTAFAALPLITGEAHGGYTSTAIYQKNQPTLLSSNSSVVTKIRIILRDIWFAVNQVARMPPIGVVCRRSGRVTRVLQGGVL